MVCKKCGAVLKGEWMFCPDCGEKLKDESDLFNIPSSDFINENDKDTEVSNDINEASSTEEKEDLVKGTDEESDDYDEDDEDEEPTDTTPSIEDIEKFMNSEKEQLLKNEASLKNKERMNHVWRSKVLSFLGIFFFTVSFILSLVWIILMFLGGEIYYGLAISSLIVIVLSIVMLRLAINESRQVKENNILKVVFMIVDIAVLGYSFIFIGLDKLSNQKTQVYFENINEVTLIDSRVINMEKHDLWVTNKGEYYIDYSSGLVFVFDKEDSRIGTQEFKEMMNTLNKYAEIYDISYIVIDPDISDILVIKYNNETYHLSSNSCMLVHSIKKNDNEREIETMLLTSNEDVIEYFG